MTNGTIAVLGQRAWQAMAGIATLAFVMRFLSPIEQGYYYTLASLASLHMAFDMGLSTTLVQFSAREFIGLSWQKGGMVDGVAKAKFLELARSSVNWYLTSALIFFLIYPIGLVFLSHGQGALNYDWHIPWFLLVCSTAVGLVILPIFTLVEGSGRISEVYMVRLIQGVLGAGAAWLVLAYGGGLYAVAMTSTLGALVAGIWVLIFRRKMLLQVIRVKVTKLKWSLEIWPLQWRIAVSWLAGYVLVQMYTPLLFRTHGPEMAGQMGVTITVANMISLLSLAWMTAKIPAMAQATSLREWSMLDLIFWRAFRLSVLSFVVGAMAFIMIRYILDSTPYGVRFLPFSETVVLLLAMGFYHVSGLFAAYLRAHLREPFLWPSLIVSGLTVFAAVWVAPTWGAAGIVTILLAVNALLFFPMSLVLWNHLRRKWHRDPLWR